MPKERFVTWRGYLAARSLRAGFSLFGWVAGMLGALLTAGLLFAIGLAFLMLRYNRWLAETMMRPALALTLAGGAIALIGGGGLVCWALLKAGEAMLEAAEDVPEVTLITRENTGQMPPKDSLVRGAGRPEHNSVEFLLRGAGGPDSQSIEELLHPVQTSESSVSLQQTAGR